MDIDALLVATLDANPSIRGQAEFELEKQSHNPDALYRCLQIVSSAGSVHLSLAASVFLKNALLQGRYTIFSPDQRTLFKNSLFAVMVSSARARPAAFRTIIQLLPPIIDVEFSAGQFHLITDIQSLIQSSDPSAVYCGVCASTQVMKYYESRLPQERPAFESAIGAIFPTLQSMCSQIVSSTHSQRDHTTGHIVWKILKTLRAAIVVDLPQPISSQLTIWIQLLISILHRQLPGQDGNDDDDGAIGWKKSQKWSLRIINLIFTRYCTDRQDNYLVRSTQHQYYEQVTEVFVKELAPQIITLYLGFLASSHGPSTILHDVRRQMLIFFTECISIDYLWEMVHRRSNLIYLRLVFYSFRQRCDGEDGDDDDDFESLFTEQPQAYLLLQSLPAEEEDHQLTANWAAMKFLSVLRNSRPSVLTDVLDALIGEVDQVTSGTRLSLIYKDAAVRVANVISPVPGDYHKGPFIAKLYDMANRFVYPELSGEEKLGGSTHNIERQVLIARACEFFTCYAASLPFDGNQDTLKNIYVFVLSVLSSGSTFSVVARVNSIEALAALSSNPLVEQSHLPRAMETFEHILPLLAVAPDLSSLAYAVRRYVTIYAAPLMECSQRVCKLFNSAFFSHQNRTPSLALLKAISTFVDLFEKKRGNLSDIGGNLAPILAAAIGSNSDDENFRHWAFDVVESILQGSGQVSTQMWSVFEAIVGGVNDEEFDEDLTTCCYYFALYGISQVAVNQPYSEALVNLFLNTQRCARVEGPLSAIQHSIDMSLNIVLVMLTNAPTNSLDHLLDGLTAFCISPGNNNRGWLLFSALMYYNAKETLVKLSSINELVSVLERWINYSKDLPSFSSSIPDDDDYGDSDDDSDDYGEDDGDGKHYEAKLCALAMLRTVASTRDSDAIWVTRLMREALRLCLGKDVLTGDGNKFGTGQGGLMFVDESDVNSTSLTPAEIMEPTKALLSSLPLHRAYSDLMVWTEANLPNSYVQFMNGLSNDQRELHVTAMNIYK
uniref:ARAD1D01276p n=1 Tax=Blastobotrys adeninivorans TaxID=409370 RepID=A0A060TDL9_BLAAD